MEKIKLSIITPNHNHGADLIRYFSTLEDKNLSWVEFIIIDDCSTDNSREILTKYSSNSRLNTKIINNITNVGPGSSRNIGLKNSSGDYITFLDSDDCFVSNFFDIIYKSLNDVHDLIVFDYYSINGKKKTICSIFNPKLDNDSCINDLVAFVRGAPWGKIYKKSLLVDHNIEFLDIKRHEDTPFTKVAVSFCKDYVYLKEPLYCYKYDKKSLAHNKKYIDPINSIKSLDYILKNINHDISKHVINYLIAIEFYYTSGVMYSLIEKRSQWKKTISLYSLNAKDLKNNPYFKSLSRLKRIIILNVLKRRYLLTKIACLIVFGRIR